MNIRKTNDGNQGFIRQPTTFAHALREISDQLMVGLPYKTMNPIYQFMKLMTGIKNFTSFQRAVYQNCIELRAVVVGYVQKRKQGKATSMVGNKSDILSLFMENPDVFTDEIIVDECLGIITAAVLATSCSAQGAIVHLSQSKESLSRLRGEFKDLIDQSTKEDP